MLCLAQTALIGVSPSASRRIPMICSSLYWLFLIVLLPFFSQQNSPFVTSSFLGSGQYHANVMFTTPIGSQEWNNALNWSQKVAGKIRDLHKLKKSSPEKNQLD